MKMDSSIINKEGIEKLLTMLPSEEEVSKIEEAQEVNPELPLGTAEQFLITLSSISGLEARLRLWAFKIDFEDLEKEICEPLADLKLGLEALSNNLTFKSILNVTLTIGNFLNGSSAKGFNIDYLAKVFFIIFIFYYRTFILVLVSVLSIFYRHRGQDQLRLKCSLLHPGARGEGHGAQALVALPPHLLRP